MAREMLTREEMRDWLTAELRKHEGCEEMTVLMVMGLQEEDETGCNWSDTLHLSGDVSREVYLPALTAVVREARARFNVLPDRS